MEKTLIPNGKMFIYFDPSYMDAPRVYVKVTEKEVQGGVASVFVDNQAIVRFSVDGTEISSWDSWSISDQFFGKMVREGKFAPIDDLRECDDICLQLGWPRYEMEIGE